MLFSKKKEDPQAVPEASPENDFSPSLSQQDSSASPYENDVKKLEEEAEQTPIVDIPKKPASAYVTVSIFCLFIAFGGFVFGWDTGTISGFVAQTDFIRRLGQKRADGTHYLSKVRTGLVVSIFNIGCAIGGVILSKLGDVYGRKPGLIIVVVIYVVGIVIQIATIDKWYQYFIGRIISGLGVGGIAVLSPMLISEVSPKHLRATLVACYQLMITLGIFLGYCTNFGTKNYSNSVQWRVPLGLCFAWAIFMISGMTFVPESPRFLVEKGRIEDAKRSIASSNKVSVDDPAVVAEVDSVQAAVEAERLAGSASWGELFSTKTKIFQRLVMGIMIQSLQQLTGDNYFFYYGTIVFKAVGLEDSFETSIVIGVVNFFSTFVGIFLVGRFGRRTCLLWGAATMTACMVVFASVGVTRLWPHGKGNGSSKGAGNCMIVFTCFYIFCFATTWAPLAFVICSETFPLRVKAKCMALAQASNWIWGFLISFFTPFITGAINFNYGYVFMGCLCFSYFYVFFFVPETKGLTLEEVNTMWEEGVLPWKASQWVPPSRRGADYDADALMHDDTPWYKRFL
ncbi:High-affinity hexose transporter HXT6 [Nakaseomyces glabratus]|uniref:High-affinity hexose transporter HXT6 n=1 Tax=Candida glabrata TaxID=5478 RepID=A0A0W0DYZ4_CANGB|nr:Major facilitator superfamily (MFS) profile [Nakaseomyces glabratus]KAH7591821.1 Major facilitator superfamily (MFS) profile [Nakaseomyces glabratus]KAH7598852.1 Major facilitator superfamily (MFS) profile [Nakaseomyces glabratus]KAH7609707.1 Major facilitator superfamily (MFS) profile [Nakaseomyces glabratus]KAH7615415.1 Major facilitator superfamily (MFS) profile [Nakaseomyces glabratus]